MARPVIDVRDLSKSYRVARRPSGFRAAMGSIFRRQYETVEAVRELSFTVEPGERIGFLGPNGAGKTTTLKMLSGLLHPTSGTATVSGFVPHRREASFLRSVTLVMGQKQQLLWDLPPCDTFEMNRAIYGVPRATFAATMRELEALLGIADIQQIPTRQLSLGQRMKCELAAALLHAPNVLFLDEPTIGLDVSMQLAVRDFIRAYNERTGATVILTSHYMDDVASLCDRVVVVDAGRLRYDGDLPTLVRRFRPHKRIALRFAAPPQNGVLERVGVVVEADATRAVLEVDATKVREAVGELLAQASVVDLTVEDPPLEEVMRDLFAAPEPSPSDAQAGAPP